MTNLGVQSVYEKARKIIMMPLQGILLLELI